MPAKDGVSLHPSVSSPVTYCAGDVVGPATMVLLAGWRHYSLKNQHFVTIYTTRAALPRSIQRVWRFWTFLKKGNSVRSL
jgi:hypothetical protein